MKNILILGSVLGLLTACGTSNAELGQVSDGSFPQIEQKLLDASLKSDCTLSVDQTVAVLRPLGVQGRSQIRAIFDPMFLNNRAKIENKNLVVTFGACAHKL